MLITSTTYQIQFTVYTDINDSEYLVYSSKLFVEQVRVIFYINVHTYLVQ